MQRFFRELGLRIDKLFSFSRLRRQALLGEVDNKLLADGAVIDDPKIGQSMSFPLVQEIVVDNEKSAPAGVGRIVERTFFDQKKALIFNVAFSCGKAGAFSKGVYGDPLSIWFNVFFGYYEIDVRKAEWGRPFGYNVDGSVCFEDVLKIGKSDWNYFSNYVYGVPDKFIRETNAPLADADTKTLHHGRVAVGDKHFDLVELDGVLVSSAYLAGVDGRRLIDEDLVLSPLWRVAFGHPCPRPDFKTSFFPVRMRAKLYMCFREVPHDNDLDAPAYQTFLFGGTTNGIYPDAAENERFLDLQLRAVEKVMTGSYRDVGF